MSEAQSRFLIIDGHAIIYRAYHAFPPLTSPQGILVNAVYGFSRILLTAIREHTPEYIVVTFDHKKPTFRAQEYAQYKANRPEMPVDLRPQIELVKEVVSALNIPQFEMEGYEADDLIGTITRQMLEKKDILTIVVTGDKDMFQLVDEQTHVWMPARGKFGVDTEYDPESVQKKMGVTPAQIVDLKALMGDTSDNIPGVKGIGPKTAVQLIQEFKNIEGVYATVEKIAATGEKPKSGFIKGNLFERLRADKENAFLSKKLATIDRHAPIEFQLEPCLVSDYDKEKIAELFIQLEFKSLIGLLPKDTFELGVQSALF